MGSTARGEQGEEQGVQTSAQKAKDIQGLVEQTPQFLPVGRQWEGETNREPASHVNFSNRSVVSISAAASRRPSDPGALYVGPSMALRWA